MYKNEKNEKNEDNIFMNNIRKYNDKLNVIGDKIRYYREKQNLSLVDLSNKLLLLGIDIPKNSLQRLEHGNRIIKEEWRNLENQITNEIMYYYELAGFSKVLGVSTDILLKDFMNELN